MAWLRAFVEDGGRRLKLLISVLGVSYAATAAP